MAADEFTWKPDVGVSGEVTHRKIETQFGDGYTQAVGDGINTKTDKQQVSFTEKSADIIAIMAFLDARAGVTSFTWTPPLGVQCKWRAGPYTRVSLGADVYRLTVTFQQVYA